MPPTPRGTGGPGRRGRAQGAKWRRQNIRGGDLVQADRHDARIPPVVDPLRPCRPPPPPGPAARRPIHAQPSSPPRAQRGHRAARRRRSDIDDFPALSHGRRRDGHSRRKLERRAEDGRDRGDKADVWHRRYRWAALRLAGHVPRTPVRARAIGPTPTRGPRESHPHPGEGRRAAQRPPQLRVDERQRRAGCAQSERSRAEPRGERRATLGILVEEESPHGSVRFRGASRSPRADAFSRAARLEAVAAPPSRVRRAEPSGAHRGERGRDLSIETQGVDAREYHGSLHDIHDRGYRSRGSRAGARTPPRAVSPRRPRGKLAPTIHPHEFQGDVESAAGEPAPESQWDVDVPLAVVSFAASPIPSSRIVTWWAVQHPRSQVR